MSAFVLKLIAVITMTCDHISYLIFGHFSFLNYIGRLAFPIFAYQISEGYTHTSNLKKYFLRLLIFALISQIPFLLFCSIFSSGWGLNIFFTLLLGLLSIIIYDKLDKLQCKSVIIHKLLQIIAILSTIILSIIANITKCDYSYFGVLTIFSFYMFRNKKSLMNLSFITLVIIYYGKKLILTFNSMYILIIVFTLSSLIFINLYNHKKGKDTKYLLYLFYPAHLLIIYSIYFVLNYTNL